jgi:pyridoxal 5'-phosphate synthase pdxS subunit
MATDKETGTFQVKTGLAQMLKGGVIMDVVNAEQAKIAEDAGACRHPSRRRCRPHVRSQHD